MQQWQYRKIIWGGMTALGLVASLTGVEAGTTSPASPAAAPVKLARLRVGLRPKLVEVDFPRVRELYRT